MTLHPEKIKRTQEMINEIRNIERFIEQEITSAQIRLDEHRKRRGILQDYLEERVE